VQAGRNAKKKKISFSCIAEAPPTLPDQPSEGTVVQAERNAKKKKNFFLQ